MERTMSHDSEYDDALGVPDSLELTINENGEAVNISNNEDGIEERGNFNYIRQIQPILNKILLYFLTCFHFFFCAFFLFFLFRMYRCNTIFYHIQHSYKTEKTQSKYFYTMRGSSCKNYR